MLQFVFLTLLYWLWLLTTLYLPFLVLGGTFNLSILRIKAIISVVALFDVCFLSFVEFLVELRWGSVFRFCSQFLISWLGSYLCLNTQEWVQEFINNLIWLLSWTACDITRVFQFLGSSPLKSSFRHVGVTFVILTWCRLSLLCLPLGPSGKRNRR